MSCLFDSLSSFLQNTSSYQLRQIICDFLEKDDFLFDEFRPSDIAKLDNMTLSEYISKMRKPSCWGSSVEIRAFTKIYNMNVYVINLRGETPRDIDTRNGVVTFIPNKTIEFIIDEKSPVVKLTWTGGHYEACRSQ